MPENALLDLKIQDKSLKEMKRISSIVSFISLKMDFFTILARTLSIFLRVFPNFTVSSEGCLRPPPHKNVVLFKVS